MKNDSMKQGNLKRLSSKWDMCNLRRRDMTILKTSWRKAHKKDNKRSLE